MQFFDIAGQDVEALRREYESAAPFPHLVLDGLLKLDPSVASAFPGSDWHGWNRYTDAHHAGKASCGDIEQIPSPFADIIRASGDPPFLEFIERVTGIHPLIPDPYLEGGGLHSSGAGGILMPHTDFHFHQRLQLFRQINILIYLNPEWTAELGGCLELFSDPKATEAAVRVVPEFGRTVIFRTDDRSVHGFPIPVIAGRRRNSIALYYYTSQDTTDFAGDVNTYWRRRPTTHTGGRLRSLGYRTALQAARVSSRIAHELMPKDQ